MNIVDDFTREYVAIEVDRSLPRLRVVRVLDRIAESIGLAAILVMDNGPEFSDRASTPEPTPRRAAALHPTGQADRERLC